MFSTANVLNDVRATELFLRQILVDVADRFVYVIDEFTFEEQKNINDLVVHLSTVGKLSTNPLIVIHNMRQVASESVLHEKIAVRP